MSLCENISLPDDVTVGYIIGKLYFWIGIHIVGT